MKDPGDLDGDGIAVIPVKTSRNELGVSAELGLLVSARGLAAAHIMHCLAVKFCAMLRWPFRLLPEKAHGMPLR